MIFLFDNCYLSTTNNLLENAKQVWIGTQGSRTNKIGNPYRVIAEYESIDEEGLDALFNEIHNDHSADKVVIYADNNHFAFVYFFFYGALLSEEAAKELFLSDIQKENYGIGGKNYGLQVVGFRDVNFVTIPKKYTLPASYSTFAGTTGDMRVELAFIASILGDADATQFCVDRISEMWDGSPGFLPKFVEQNIPAFIPNTVDYTVSNLQSQAFIEGILQQWDFDEIIPDKVLPKVRDEFNFDYITHMATVVNNMKPSEYVELWESAAIMAKDEIIESYIINPECASKVQLIFPNLSNFDSVNPIFWNKILKNYTNTSWLEAFVINGTNN